MARADSRSISQTSSIVIPVNGNTAPSHAKESTLGEIGRCRPMPADRCAFAPYPFRNPSTGSVSNACHNASRRCSASMTAGWRNWATADTSALHKKNAAV